MSAMTAAPTDSFWATIAAQLAELRTAKNADDVIRILSHDRNPAGADVADSAADGFFAGSGGDETVLGSLLDAAWRMVWAEAHYYYVAVAPDGSAITYIEGDIYRGDRRPGQP